VNVDRPSEGIDVTFDTEYDSVDAVTWPGIKCRGLIVSLNGRGGSDLLYARVIWALPTTAVLPQSSSGWPRLGAFGAFAGRCCESCSWLDEADTKASLVLRLHLLGAVVMVLPKNSSNFRFNPDGAVVVEFSDLLTVGVGVSKVKS
jgi:hypothetical protein